VRSVDAVIVSGGDHGIDDSFFGACTVARKIGLSSGLQQSSDRELPLGSLTLLLAVEKAIKMSPEPSPEKLPMRPSPSEDGRRRASVALNQRRSVAMTMMNDPILHRSTR